MFYWHIYYMIFRKSNKMSDSKRELKDGTKVCIGFILLGRELVASMNTVSVFISIQSEIAKPKI